MPGKLIVIVGDSNAVGQGDTDHSDGGLKLTTAFASVTGRHYYSGSLTDPVIWTDTGATSLQPYHAGGSPGMGIELTLGREMFATGSATYIATFAINGTRAEDYKPTATSPVSGGNLYSQLITYINGIQTATGLTLGAVVLELSTNDAVNGTDAGNYGANITAIISGLRSTYGAIPVLLPRLNVACTNTFTSTVIAAQVAYVAGDSNTLLVSSDDLALTGGVHYLTDGYATRGQRFAYVLSDKLGYGRTQVAALAPVVIGRDVVSYGTGALSPTAWAGGVNGDMEVLVVITGFGTSAAGSLTTAAGFTQQNSTQISSALGLDEYLLVYTRTVASGSFVNGRMPTPTFTPNGSNLENAAVIFTVRSNATVLIDGSAISASNAYGTPWATMTGRTTGHANTLEVLIAGGFSGSGTNTTTEANSNITGLAEYSDGYYFSNADFVAVILASGAVATLGSVTGNSTITSATNTILAGMELGLYSTPARVTSIAITPTSFSLAPAATQQMVATATRADGSTLDCTATATWLSSNPAKATISATGLVTAVAAGTTNITASFASLNASVATSPAQTATIAAAVPNFIKDNTGLYADKVDSIQPVKAINLYVDATDLNLISGALKDTQSFLRGAASWYGLTPVAADPAPAGLTNYIWLKNDATLWQTVSGVATKIGGAGVTISSGAVTPNTNVTGSVGDLYTWTGGGAGTTLWVKESGAATNTGWVAK